MIFGLLAALPLLQAPSPTAIAVAPDGKLLLLANPDGGIFRSHDGGATWTVVKIPGKGVSAIAIDPNNPRRCLLASFLAPGTVRLSADAGKTWRKVLNFEVGDLRADSFTFDPTTYDKKKDRSPVVHWSGPHGLFRSADGGESWTETPQSQAYGNASLRHHPMLRDALFVASPTAIFQSTDAGRSFVTILREPVAGFDVADAAVDTAWTARANGLWRSRDAGRSWQPLTPKKGLRPGEPLLGVRISPDDPDRMLVQRKVDGRWYLSHDGGNAWRPVSNAGENAGVAWSPLDRNVVWATVPNGVRRSTDGGLTWRLARLPMPAATVPK